MGDDENKNDSLFPAMSFGDHLEELRLRLILALAAVALACIVCVCFGKYIIAFIEKPFIDVMGADARQQVLAPTEGIITYMQVCLISGLVIASPWVFFQLWMFVASGLYEKEKKYVYKAVPFSVGLFIAGALLFIFVIAPYMLKFLIFFNKQFIGVESNFTFKNYISFIMLMMLVFGLSFQTPIVVLILTKTEIVPLETFRKWRKSVIMVIVVLASAILPGSEIFSLIALSLCMYLLYELGIILSNRSLKKRKAEKPNKES